MIDKTTNAGNVIGKIFPLEVFIPIIKFEYSINKEKRGKTKIGKRK